jgi:hypothetical protein
MERSEEAFGDDCWSESMIRKFSRAVREVYDAR